MEIALFLYFRIICYVVYYKRTNKDYRIIESERWRRQNNPKRKLGREFGAGGRTYLAD